MGYGDNLSEAHFPKTPLLSVMVDLLFDPESLSHPIENAKRKWDKTISLFVFYVKNIWDNLEVFVSQL